MSDTKFGAWAGPEADLVTVEYSLVVIEEIRQAVTEGFQRFARGGIEVGGVLYGTYDGKTVRVLAVRDIACEHAHGPSFALSDKDRAALTEQIERDRLDVRLEGFQVLGFYVSHTRSEIILHAGDQETYEAFFPELWQVALVVEPGRAGTMRAGFFVREADGTVKTDHSYLDFNFPDRSAIPPSQAERRPLASERRGLQPGAPQGLQQSLPYHAAAAELPETAYPPRAQAALGYEPTGEANTAYAGRQPYLPPTERAPEYLPYPDQQSHWQRWAIAAVVVLAAALLVGVGWRYFNMRTPVEPISLTVFEPQADGAHEGQLRVEWNHNAAPVRDASSGTLQITDGKDPQTVTLSREDLRRGSFTYVRHSGDVQVRLEVQNANGEKTQEGSRFLGTPPRVADANELDTVQLERDALKDEVTRLRNENTAQTARIQQLDRTLTILRLRLGIAAPAQR